MPYVENPKERIVLETAMGLNQENTGDCTGYSAVGYIQSTAKMLGQPIPDIDPIKLFNAEAAQTDFYWPPAVFDILAGKDSPFPISLDRVQEVPYVANGGYRPAIVQAIAQNHMVLIAMRCDFQVVALDGAPAKTGYWTPLKNDWWVGAHAAYIHGYDLSMTTDALLKSSWGQSYGIDGGFWFPMDSHGSLSEIITDAWILNLYDQEPVQFEPKTMIHIPEKPRPQIQVVETRVHGVTTKAPVKTYEKTPTSNEMVTLEVTMPQHALSGVENIAKLNHWNYKIVGTN